MIGQIANSDDVNVAEIMSHVKECSRDTPEDIDSTLKPKLRAIQAKIQEENAKHQSLKSVKSNLEI